MSIHGGLSALPGQVLSRRRLSCPAKKPIAYASWTAARSASFSARPKAADGGRVQRLVKPRRNVGRRSLRRSKRRSQPWQRSVLRRRPLPRKRRTRVQEKRGGGKTRRQKTTRKTNTTPT